MPTKTLIKDGEKYGGNYVATRSFKDTKVVCFGANPKKVFDEAKEKGIKFSYFVDETQQVAKKYGAVCTPDPFLFDHEKRLVFHGRIDNAMSPEDVATEKTMILNIEKMLQGKKIERGFDPSMGCSIKWKSQQT